MTDRGKAYAPLAIISLVFVAFFLRLHQLDGQSLWWDEVLTAVIVREPFLAMLDTAALYLHPPFYYIVLHWWTQVAGASDWATRFPSVVFGTALVPLLFVVGKRLSGVSLGLFAAIIGALSPFLVHYSQEARDYSLAVTLSLASIYFLVAAIERGGPRDWSIWGAVSVVSAYTEYLFLLVFAAEAMSVVAFLILRRRRPSIHWLSAVLVVPVSLIPWLLYSRSLSGAAGEIARGTDLGTLVRDTLVVFNLGTAVKVDDATVPALCMFAMAIAGAFLHRNRLKAALFVAPTLVLPLVALYLLSVGRRDYAVRYSLVAYPSYVLLLALGLDWMRTKAKLLSAVTVLAISVAALIGVYAYYYDYQFSRDDFRAAARYYDDQVRPGDVLVFNAAWGEMAFDYYSSSGSPGFGIDSVLPTDEKQLNRMFSDLASRYDRIWLVGWQDYFSDPDNKIRQWLDDNTTQMAFKPFRLIALTGYRTAPVVMRSIPKIQNAASTDFDNGIRFLGYDLDTSQTGANGRLYVTFYWQARGPIAKSFNVYVKLIDQGYQVWGQKDNRPVYDRLPTDSWHTGQVFRDEYALEILPGTPPG
ncbi:MAG: glycosyltransferase family 39 protein, partial [Dehalococcoidia bacterium]|nr:glycosyltransferase family 39 protein [Dehalococcoidia bacterium]